MSGPMTLLTIALRGLQAHQAALDVAGHNLANAATPGASRQEAVLVPGPAIALPGLTLGSGVEVAAVRRARAAWLDPPVRAAAAALGEAEAERAALERLEALFPDPAPSGLQTQLDRFFAAWHDLAADPASAATRAALAEQASTLGQTFNRTAEELDRQARDLEQQLAAGADEVSRLLARLAELDAARRRAEGQGQSANDAADQLDLALDELARWLPVDALAAPGQPLALFVEGQPLLQAGQPARLEARPDPVAGGRLGLTLDGGATFLALAGGRLGGLARARDAALAQQAELDDLARALRDAVNQQHQQGQGLDGASHPFFDGTDARSLRLAQDIQTSLDAIAAAAAGAGPGDGSNALAIARLQTVPVAVGPATATLGDAYRAQLAALGARARAAAQAEEARALVLAQAERQRAAVSGISLDEEATRLIELQRAYQAAARVATAADELLAIVLERLGLVGR